jgi:hypothetical protein
MIRVHPGHQVPDGLPSPDIYFLQGYGQAAGVADDGTWVLVMRTLVDGENDAISPAYSGVYASPSLSPEQVQQAWSATIDCLRDRGVISVVLRQSPFLPRALDLPETRSIVSGWPTIVLEATDSDSAWNSDSAWDGMAGTCRTRIRKALKNGYTGDVRQATEQDLLPLSDFRRLYEQTMRRIGADPLYLFGDDYYRKLLDGVGSNLFITEVRDQAGIVVSSTMLLRHEQRLHYHHTGSDVDHTRMGINNLMLWTATKFAIDQSLREFHLGGGVALRDSLFKFKHTFGGRELLYGVSGQIIDQKRYQSLTERRAKACDTTADTLMDTNYFPAYRAGAAHA